MPISAVSYQNSTIPPVVITPQDSGVSIPLEVESSSESDESLSEQSSEERRQGTILQLGSDQNSVETVSTPQPEEVEFTNELIRIQEQYLSTFEEYSDIPTQQSPLFELQQGNTGPVLAPPDPGESDQARSLTYVNLVV